MGWTKLIGVAGVDSKANSVAVDGSGNIYVTGRTKGNLDGQTMTGTEDAFLIKYDSSGETLNFRREKPHVSVWSWPSFSPLTHSTNRRDPAVE